MNSLPIDGSQIYVTLYGLSGSWALQDTGVYTAAGGVPQRPGLPKKAGTITLQPKH